MISSAASISSLLRPEILVCLERMKTAGTKNRLKPTPAGAKSATPRPAVPPLSPAQIALLRHSFAVVEKKAGIAGLVFYRNLFNLSPSLRALFQNDIELQGCKFMEALSFTIETLEDPAALTPVLEALGRRHVGYGTRDEHYAIVIEALMLTLQQSLGSKFTQATARAWRRALTHLANTVKRGSLAGGSNCPVVGDPEFPEGGGTS
jgi:hemoglobin-like flavoprotein